MSEKLFSVSLTLVEIRHLLDKARLLKDDEGRKIALKLNKYYDEFKRR